MTEAALEVAVDKALAKADYNLDGLISWQEYHYSLSDKDSDHHHEYETHEVDDHPDDHKTTEPPKLNENKI